MTFSSRRRNYLLTPHRRDGFIEWMKSMLQHSFVLNVLDSTAADTFTHFEELIEEHRKLQLQQQQQQQQQNSYNSSINTTTSTATTGTATNDRTTTTTTTVVISKLQQLVPTIGIFHTPLLLRDAFILYNQKHHLTKRKHIQISFNEIRHILNLAQILAFRKNTTLTNTNSENSTMDANSHDTAKDNDTTTVRQQGEEQLSYLHHLNSSFVGLDAMEPPPPPTTTTTTTVLPFNGPKMITFDGDQTLYSDGANFNNDSSNPQQLAYYIYQLLRHNVIVAIVTAAGYEYETKKYEYRISGLLQYFQQYRLSPKECQQFYLFGGECNYLLQLGIDYQLHPVPEYGPNGWKSNTAISIPDSPGNWTEEQITLLLDISQQTLQSTCDELQLKGRVIRKRRSVGLVPLYDNHTNTYKVMTRESLDEAVLRIHETLHYMNHGYGPGIPFCAFNGGSDVWVDCGSKRVGVQILQCYLHVTPEQTLHIGDQFLNTGNDYAARAASPCVWITNPIETSYCLKTILRLANVSVIPPPPPPTTSTSTTTTTTIAAQANEVDTKVTTTNQTNASDINNDDSTTTTSSAPVIDFNELERRRASTKIMDVYTGEMVPR